MLPLEHAAGALVLIGQSARPTLASWQVARPATRLRTARNRATHGRHSGPGALGTGPSRIWDSTHLGRVWADPSIIWCNVKGRRYHRPRTAHWRTGANSRFPTHYLHWPVKGRMPNRAPPYDTPEYWQARFALDLAWGRRFEWLGSGEDTLLPPIREYLAAVLAEQPQAARKEPQSQPLLQSVEPVDAAPGPLPGHQSGAESDSGVRLLNIGCGSSALHELVARVWEAHALPRINIWVRLRSPESARLAPAMVADRPTLSEPGLRRVGHAGRDGG